MYELSSVCTSFARGGDAGSSPRSVSLRPSTHSWVNTHRPESFRNTCGTFTAPLTTSTRSMSASNRDAPRRLEAVIQLLEEPLRGDVQGRG